MRMSTHLGRLHWVIEVSGWFHDNGVFDECVAELERQINRLKPDMAYRIHYLMRQERDSNDFINGSLRGFEKEFIQYNRCKVKAVERAKRFVIGPRHGHWPSVQFRPAD